MNIQRSSILSLAVIFVALTHLSGTKGTAADEDFKASNFSFTVYRYSDATRAALEAQGEKRVVRVDIEEQCSMEDFAQTCNHVWIKELEFKNGAPLITSFEPLAKLIAMEELDASSLEAAGETPFDLTPLAGLENLEKLFLTATKSKNFAALAKLSKLESVSLRMTGVDSLEFLSGSPGIERLDLYGKSNTFPDYSPLGGLQNLVIEGNAQASGENLAVLSSLTSLKSISMDDCSQVTSLSFLKGSAASLTNLHASDCEALTDVALLAEMTSLEWLIARGLKTDDLSFLSKMPKLSALNLQKVKVADLSVFSGMTSLKTVHLTKDMLPEGAEGKLAEMLPEAKFYIK